MDNKLEDFLDSITQEELQQWEQIDFMNMEDKLSQKRIQKMVNKKCKKYPHSLAVAACFLLLLAIVTVKPVQAELERIFHFIPDIGLVESDMVYEVEILCGKLQKDNVTIELKDCYVKDNFLFGTISITDTSPYDYQPETLGKVILEGDEIVENEMYEKYPITWYHGEKQNTLFFPHAGLHLRENFKQLNQYLQLIIDDSESLYHEIAVGDFHKKLSFRLKKSKPIFDLKEIGSTVTKNGTSITASAKMTKEGAKINYYAVSSEEAKTITQFGSLIYSGDKISWFYLPHFQSKNAPPYHRYYLETKEGEIAPLKSAKSLLENGGEAIFEATKKDFPAIFHYTELSAKTEECEFIDIPVPKVGQTIEVDIPIFFQYGTVKISFISHIKSVDYTGYSRINAEGEYYDEKAEMEKLILQMKIEPNQKKRILYKIDAKPVNINYDGGHLLEDENDIFSKTLELQFYHHSLEEDMIKLQFDDPIYWIEGEYEIPVDLE